MTADPGAAGHVPGTAALQETVLGRHTRCLTLGGDEPRTSFGVNCLAVSGDRETLLVDPFIAPAHARLAREAVARAGLPPVRHVVLTHHHTDHALGAGLLAREGATVVAHRRCAEAMDAQHPGIVASRRRDPAMAALFADAGPFTPDRPIEAPVEIDLGGVKVEVRPVGPGHTPGDCVVVVPADGVVAAGDLLFDGYHFNYEEADPAPSRDLLGPLSSLGAIFVPGHGRPGGRERIEAQRRYHDEAERIARSPLPAFAAARVLQLLFPDHLLAGATATAVRAWRGIPPGST